MDLFFPVFAGGDQAKICGTYAENLFRVLFGTHLQIFSKKYVFFPKHFWDPPIFFPKIRFFPLKFGHLPTFPLKINIYLYFDSWTSRRPIGVRDCVIACTPLPGTQCSFWGNGRVSGLVAGPKRWSPKRAYSLRGMSSFYRYLMITVHNLIIIRYLCISPLAIRRCTQGR